MVQRLYNEQGVAQVEGLQLPFPWQQSQWERCITRFKRGTLPHALLLSGPEGSGKALFATQLALYMLCQEQGNAARQDQQLACGQCNSCHQVLAGVHPDLLYLSGFTKTKTPIAKSSAQKAAAFTVSAIKIEAVRRLIEFQATTPVRSRCKIAIINPAQALNQAAQNALLKTLEEPSEQMFFLLITHQPSQILPTIRSRCQKLLSGLPDYTVLTHWWSQLPADLKGSLDGDAAWQLMNLHNLAPLALLQTGGQQQVEQQQVILDQLRAVACEQVTGVAVTGLEKIPLAQVIQTVWSASNDLLKHRAGSEAGYLRYRGFSTALSAQVVVNTEQLLRVQQLMAHLWRQVDSAVACNEQYALQRVLISWADVFRN